MAEPILELSHSGEHGDGATAAPSEPSAPRSQVTNVMNSVNSTNSLTSTGDEKVRNVWILLNTVLMTLGPFNEFNAARKRKFGAKGGGGVKSWFVLFGHPRRR